MLAGRDAQLEDMSVAVQRITLGRFERSIVLTGLRGVGKTVLLNEFGMIAEREGWIHEHLEATDDTKIAKAMATMARRCLLELSLRERIKDRAVAGLRVLKAFVKIHVPAGDGGALTIDVEPFAGLADSGDLEHDIGDIFREVGETAREAQTGVLFTIDELQYLSSDELSVLIVGLHRVSQLGLPLLVAGAGLPSLPGLAGEARSYAERLFSFIEIGSLKKDDAIAAVVEPVQAEGADWEPLALEKILRDSEGYPYFLQEFGKQAWNVAEGPVITAAEFDRSTVLALDELDTGFFRARVDKTSDAERNYLRAMAQLDGPGPYASGEVAASMGKTTGQVGPVRDSLIKRGLIFAPRHGQVAFTVPMFEQFILRRLT